GSGRPRAPPSLPTRRSSDLIPAKPSARSASPRAPTPSSPSPPPRSCRRCAKWRRICANRVCEDLQPIALHRVRVTDGNEGLERRSEEHTSELQSRENLVCRL